MSLTSLLSISRDAITAYSGAIDITGKNITGANTPGYVRRTALLETRQLGSQSGGVNFGGPRRMIDRFAIARVLAEGGLRGAAAARGQGLAGLEASFASAGSSSIGAQLSSFFGSATGLASNPTDMTARTQFLAQSDELAQRFRTAAGALSQRRSDLAGQAGDVAQEINGRLTEIGSLNEKIAQAQALGDAAPDLRDRRDVLVREVGDRMGVQAIEDEHGSMTLVSANATLVSGNRPGSVGVTLDPQGNLKFELTSAGGSKSDITKALEEGTLGGIRQARDTDVVALQQNLDQMAYDFATAVNGVHSAGFGLDGVSGRPLFKPPAAVAGAAGSLQLDPAMVGQPNRVAAADVAGNVPGGNVNALALAALGSSPLAGGGTPVARFGTIAAQLGTMQASAASAEGLRDDTLAMAESLRDQASGVSVEEEMIDLTRYQRAFEASMRVMKVADDLLEGLIRDV